MRRVPEVLMKVKMGDLQDEGARVSGVLMKVELGDLRWQGNAEFTLAADNRAMAAL